MKKTCISLAIVAAIQSFAVSAEQEQIETLLVTASRIAQQPVNVLAGVTSIEREDIEKLQPHSLPELLSRVAGINVARNGGPAQVSSVSVRGTNSRHVLVLVDGVRIGSATTGSTDFSSIAPENVERIEIVKGPRAALWGSDAVGGVIQIFTRKQAAGSGNANIELGSEGYYQATASVGLGDEDYQLSLNASHKRAEGFDVFNNPDASDPAKRNIDPDKDGYEKDAFGLNFNSQLTDEFAVQLTGQFEQGEYDYDSNSSFATSGGHRSEYENYSWLAKGIWSQDKWQVQGYFGQAQDQSDNIDPGFSSLFETSRDQLSLLSNYQYSNQGSITLGGDFYDEEVRGSSTQHETQQRDITAFYANLQHEFGALRLDAAVRQDDVEDFDKENTYNLSVGYQWQSGWLLAISKGTAFKAPSFNDRYWPGAGNPALRAEESDSEEVLLRYSQSDLSFEASIYRNDVEDMIRWAEVAPDDWRPSNVDNVEIQGIDFSLDWDINDQLAWYTAITYTDAEDSSTGDTLTRSPKWTALTALTLSQNEFSLTGELDLRSDSVDGFGGSVRLAGYGLLNVRAEYQLSTDLKLNLALNNLFDKEYQTVNNYNNQGSQARLGLNYQF